MNVNFTKAEQMGVNYINTSWLIFVTLMMTAGLSMQVSPPLQECGVSIGCFKWPSGCKDNECKILIRFLKTGSSTMHIEIIGLNVGWVAFGLSDKSRVMGGVKGEVCMRSGSTLVLKSFENKETDFHLKPLDVNISTQGPFFVNGRLSCPYSRAIHSPILQDMSKPHYVTISWGRTKMKGSKIHAHEHETGDYFWSKSKVVLAKIANVEVTTFGWNLIAAHGSLMVIAWIGFGFSGVFYAKHMRDTWGQRKLCGTTLWFQAHRVSLFICTAFVIIAFIIILAEAEGWNTEMEVHPVLGIITIVFLGLQVLAGVLRPAVNSPKRIMFKYAHRISGVVTCICAVVTIFLGLAAMGVDLAVLIVYVAIVLILFIGLTAFSFFKGRKEVPYKDTELDSTESDSSDKEVVTYNPKEVFAQKAISIFFTCFGIGMAFILVALIAHKGFVYHSKSVAT